MSSCTRTFTKISRLLPTGHFKLELLCDQSPDTIVAKSDEVTMTTEDGRLHIPVLQNDYSKDRSAVCITKDDKRYSEEKQVK